MDSHKYLCFSLGNDAFAIPLMDVREVITLPKITPIPQSKNYVLGISNLRGEIISILDLRKKFNLEGKLDKHTSIIIVEVNLKKYGMVVDSVNKVIEPSASEINEKPDSTSSGPYNSIVNKVINQEDSLILTMNIPATLEIDALNSQTKPAAA